MDLQSIATESQTLRSTIRDKRSVIATDEERLERHRNELKAALLRLDELESEASVAFASIRAPAQAEATPSAAPLTAEEQEVIIRAGRIDSGLSIFGEPAVAAE